MTIWRWFLGGLVAGTVLAGCGGGTSGSARSAGPPIPTPTPAPTYVVVTVPPSVPLPPPAGVPAWSPAQHTNDVVFAFHQGHPTEYDLFAPNQTQPSFGTLDGTNGGSSGGFDARGELVITAGFSLERTGLVATAPDRSVTTVSIRQNGFLAAANGDVVIGNVDFLGGLTGPAFTVPGVAAAISANGEVAAIQADGSVQTFARGSAQPRYTLPLPVSTPPGRPAAYDSAGDLAVANGASVSVYDPAGRALFTVSASTPVEALTFDRSNRLLVGDAAAVSIYGAGSPTRVGTIAAHANALAVSSAGDIGIAGYPAMVVHPDGTTTIIPTIGIGGALSVSFSP